MIDEDSRGVLIVTLDMACALREIHTMMYTDHAVIQFSKFVLQSQLASFVSLSYPTLSLYESNGLHHDTLHVSLY